MKPRLLDINVLIALSWPQHVHHSDAQRWFARIRGDGFRTCPLTQAGLVRIISNPSFSKQAVAPTVGLELLDRITSLPEHEFWPDDLTLSQAMPPGLAILGHRQITDAYLVALAAARGGIVATLDRGMQALAVGREALVEIL